MLKRKLYTLEYIYNVTEIKSITFLQPSEERTFSDKIIIIVINKLNYCNSSSK